VIRLDEAWGQPDKAAEGKNMVGLADLLDDIVARP
jgi:hypothetical protein